MDRAKNFWPTGKPIFVVVVVVVAFAAVLTVLFETIGWFAPLFVGIAAILMSSAMIVRRSRGHGARKP